MILPLTELALAMAVPAGPPVTIEYRPAYVAVVRAVEGDYRQHAEVARTLLAAARAACAADGVVYGVYPQDPDAMPAARLHWHLGYRMKPGTRCRRAPLGGFALEAHPAEQVALLESRLADARPAGLSLFHWLADNGFVQTGPTRMEYYGDGGPATRVVIVLPVRKRPE